MVLTAASGGGAAGHLAAFCSVKGLPVGVYRPRDEPVLLALLLGFVRWHVADNRDKAFDLREDWCAFSVRQGLEP